MRYTRPLSMKCCIMAMFWFQSLAKCVFALAVDFQENCPATAEILSCIKLKQNSLGVISFSTFSGKGKVDFVKNPEKFSTF